MRDKTYKDPYSGNYYSDKYQYTERDTYKNIEVIMDEKYYEECYSLYSNVLSASGLNLLDPVKSNLTHINKLQKRTVDPPYSGKSYIFVTRPDLNFWEQRAGITNVENVELLSYFSKMEIGKEIMPWLMYPSGMKMEFTYGGEQIRTSRSRIGNIDISSKNDIFTPFIPMFSNLCTATSGGKDISIDVMETEGDFHGNRLQYPKGADESFGIGEINLDCIDMYGSPILHLVNMWVHYIHHLCKGDVVSWGQYVRYKILDFTCSIYIFMTDKDNQTITRWCKYTGCFPKNVPIGAIQHSLEANADQLRNISIPFAYNRYEAMKPSTLSDFNFLMCKFLLDDNKNNIQRMIDYGISPPKLLNPNIDPTELISSHPEWSGPKYRDNNNEMQYKDVTYHDDKFWGTYPYVLDHKLLWINPITYFNNK
ncbi:MAG TPA: hypothetical protein PK507_04045 [bacterium]|nr:hypothetical protein [bacterium]